MNERTTGNEQRTTIAAALSVVFFLSGAASLLFETRADVMAAHAPDVPRRIFRQQRVGVGNCPREFHGRAGDRQSDCAEVSSPI